MIVTSGGLLQKFADPNSSYSVVQKVVYYDTPYSVPSWGMKRVTYDNSLYYAGDGEFHNEEIVNVARDPVLSHSWGEAGPPVLGGNQTYLQKWYGYFHANFTGVYKFYCTADDGVRLLIGTDANGGRLNFIPETLTSSQRITLNPVDQDETKSSWAKRSELTTYSGWVNLTEGEFFPLAVEFANFGGIDENVRGDILVRYSEPELETIIPLGYSSWRYNKVTSGDSDLGSFHTLTFSEDGDWSTGTSPFGNDALGVTGDILDDIVTSWKKTHILLLRKNIVLSADQVKNDLKLKLAVFGSAKIYWNAFKIFEVHEQLGVPYYGMFEITIPKSILLNGSNLIAVRADPGEGISGAVNTTFIDCEIINPIVLNDSGVQSQPDIKKVLSAGVVTYPFEYTWEDADDAFFVSANTPNHYYEMQDVFEIAGDKSLGTVTQYKIKLPLDEDHYKPIKGVRAHFKHVNSNVVIRPGRLIDIWAGYQTQCRFFQNDSPPACSIGLPPLVSGGFFLPNLCSTVNSKCPFQQAMPGDYVKRFRGRITNVEVHRDRDGSTLELTCEDNLTYLQTSINENYPNFVSYAAFDYAGLRNSSVNPDGIGKPSAYDGFSLNEAVEDVCVKAGIDPTYLYGKRQLITSGFHYLYGSRFLEGNDVRLTKPIRYGNPYFFGEAEDIRADEQYGWSQSYGEKLIDFVSELGENYGYLFSCDADGNILFKTRESPEFKLATSSEWYIPTNWSRVADKNALGGSYLYANGTVTDNAKIEVKGNKFNLYMTLDKPVIRSGWDVLYNEALVTSGFEHGRYRGSDVDAYGVVPPDMSLIGIVPYTVGIIDIDDFPYTMYPIISKGLESWLVISSMYLLSADRLDIALDGAFNHIDHDIVRGIEADPDGGPVSYVVDIRMGKLNPAQEYSEGNVRLGFNGTPTTVLSNYDVGWMFDIAGPTRVTFPFTTAFTMASGTQYGIKFTTKLMVNGSELSPSAQVNNFLNHGYPWEAMQDRPCFLAGVGVSTVKINDSAVPDPTQEIRVAYTPNNDTYSSTRRALRASMSGNEPSWTMYDVDDIWSNGGTNYYNIEKPYLQKYGTHFANATLSNSAWIPSGWFGVKIVNSIGEIVMERKFTNHGYVPPGYNLRYSTLGIDKVLGFNPSIYTFRGELAYPDIDGTFLKPQIDTYTVYVSGFRARIEGLAQFQDDPLSSKMKYSTRLNLYTIDAVNPTSEIRNDVIVVGRLKGYVTDPNTSEIVNPNNPTVDYVYSRAQDLGSIEFFNADNSIGKKETFIIHEPSIVNAEHADWLAYAVLDRYRKIQNQVSIDGLAVPYLELEDSIQIIDPVRFTSQKDDRYWIESIQETISRGKWDMNFSLTSLPPWASFVPTPPPDINDFRDADNGRPNLIVDMKMIDSFGLARNSNIGGKVDYDPYESEGASTDNNVGQVSVLKFSYRQLVNGFVNIQVKKSTNNAIATYLVGAGNDDGTDITYEQMPIGDYEWLWDAIDVFGRTRTAYEATEEENIVVEASDGRFPGIYSRDGKYYIEIRINSSDPNHHLIDHAYDLYDSRSTATLSQDGSILNTQSGYGEAISSYRHSLYWQLAIGEKSKLRLDTSPGINAHPHAGPRNGSSALLTFTTSDNAVPNGSVPTGLHCWMSPNSTLTGDDAIAHGNRQIKFKTSVDYHSVFVFPAQDTYKDGSVNIYTLWYPESDINQNEGNLNWRVNAPNNTWHDSVGYSMNKALPSFVSSNDGVTPAVPTGVPANCPARLSNDEHKINNLLIIKSVPRRRLTSSAIDRSDRFRTLSSPETRVVLNPTNPTIGHKYDLVSTEIKDWWEDLIANGNGGLGPIYQIAYHTGSIWRVTLGASHYKWFNKVYASRWYTIVYDVYDRSGRAPMIENTYDERQGIGLCPGTMESDVPYRNKVIVRAYWVPESSLDLQGGFFNAPTIHQINTSDTGNYAVKRFTVPGYTDQANVEVNSESITAHVLPCMAVDSSPKNWQAQVAAAGDLLSFEALASKYIFFAYPIWAFWKAPNAKASWAETLAGSSESRPGLSSRINPNE